MHVVIIGSILNETLFNKTNIGFTLNSPWYVCKGSAPRIKRTGSKLNKHVTSFLHKIRAAAIQFAECWQLLHKTTQQVQYFHFTSLKPPFILIKSKFLYIYIVHFLAFAVKVIFKWNGGREETAICNALKKWY